MTGAFEILARGGAEQAIVADLGETAGEDVLKEKGDKLLDG